MQVAPATTEAAKGVGDVCEWNIRATVSDAQAAAVEGSLEFVLILNYKENETDVAKTDVIK